MQPRGDAIWPGLRLTRTIDEATVAALRSIAKTSRATLFMTLLAAFEMMLARRLDRRDLAIGLPGANRSGQARKIRRLLLERYPIPHRAHGRPRLCRGIGPVRSASVAAFEHQHVPLDLVLAALPRRRGFGLAQTMPVFSNCRTIPTPNRWRQVAR